MKLSCNSLGDETEWKTNGIGGNQWKPSLQEHLSHLDSAMLDTLACTPGT